MTLLIYQEKPCSAQQKNKKSVTVRFLICKTYEIGNLFLTSSSSVTQITKAV